MKNKKIPQKLPEKEFLKTFEKVPRTAANLLLQDSEGRILLTRRAKPPFPGQWHYPGSFVLKGETIKECIERVKKEELGANLSYGETELLGVFDDLREDPRGHVIDIIFGCRLQGTPTLKPHGDTQEMKFFKRLPPDMGFNHRDTLHKLGFENEV